MCVYLVESSDDAQHLRFTMWFNQSWSETTIFSPEGLKIVPESLAMETTYDAGIVITYKSEDPDNKWYYLQLEVPTFNPSWQNY